MWYCISMLSISLDSGISMAQIWGNYTTAQRIPITKEASPLWGFSRRRGMHSQGMTGVPRSPEIPRGYDGKFSFDFDSQWSAVFLDSVEPSADLSSMPSLGAMLHMPLIDTWM